MAKKKYRINNSVIRKKVKGYTKKNGTKVKPYFRTKKYKKRGK